VIWLTGKDLMSPVELLEQDDPCQLMRQGHPAQGKPVNALEIQPVGAADDEAEVLAALPALLEKPAEGQRVEVFTLAVEQCHIGPVRQPPRHVLILADLDQFYARMAGQQLLVVLDVIGEWRAQPAHGDHDDPHG
jgi:hypothetical protein